MLTVYRPLYAEYGACIVELVNVQRPMTGIRRATNCSTGQFRGGGGKKLNPKIFGGFKTVMKKIFFFVVGERGASPPPPQTKLAGKKKSRVYQAIARAP